MDSFVPRMQVFEFGDQPWFPGFLLSRIQTILTNMWTVRMPPIQKTVPAEQAARLLHETLGDDLIRRRFAVVDFCSGAGGPTPSIERALNRRLSSKKGQQQGEAVDFVLTDIAPHPDAWRKAAASSPHLHFVPDSVDASAAPANLLARAGLSSSPSSGPGPSRVLRTFHLSFHHFSDAAAVAILRDTFRTADGIAVVELVERTAMGLLMNLLLILPLGLLSPFLYWDDPVMLFFMYIVPVLPAVTIFDGLMSALRCRTPKELMRLVELAQVNGEATNWEWRWGREMHTWPIGYTNYFIGWKRE